ncbi:MAG: hypothetical protein KatS3mg008_1695 [Acidimicrobiales bacterium]|nr:MAG: hypothetical protein KatS3mg008_1695 [Acidimicrobiales bacterium]
MAIGESEWWRPHDCGITVSVNVAPGARKSGITGVVEGRLLVRVAAPPVEGKANGELVKLVARVMGVRAGKVKVVRGERSRDKVLLVEGIDRPPAELACYSDA